MSNAERVQPFAEGDGKPSEGGGERGGQGVTLSARYVAMMKSCSTTNAVFLACMMKRRITLLAVIRCSESRYAEGSSTR